MAFQVFHWPHDDDILDAIGPWSEIKLEIIREYAAAYSRILSAPGQSQFFHVYVDAFAGPGRFRSRNTGAMVPGSPEIALATDPPFRQYIFIDISEIKVERLERISGERDDVLIFHGDANDVLIREVLPRIKYADYRRALVLLDPYGMHYDWKTIELLGQERTIDLFLNFPIMALNRDGLLRDPSRISPTQQDKMTAFWGDSSWRDGFYEQSQQLSMFGDVSEQKIADNLSVVRAYERRLKTLRGFRYVADSIPMRSPRTNAILYYLMFAANKKVPHKIVGDIFDKYRKRGLSYGE